MEKDGKHTKYYENEQIEEEGYYKDGEMDGKWTYYNEDGEKHSEINYKNGIKDGLFIIWTDNGIIFREEYLYKDDERNGLYTNWIIGGTSDWKHIVGNYKDDKKDGEWIHYRLEGEKFIEQYFKNGELVEYKDDEGRWRKPK